MLQKGKIMHPLFANATIPSDIPLKTYSRNQCIFNEGQECLYLCLVIKGSVAIKTFTYFDLEYTIRTINEGDLFGEFLMFAKQNNFQGAVYAQKETTIAFINKPKLLSILKDTTIMSNLLTIISQIMISTQAKVKILSQKTIRDKILFFLNSKVQENHNKTIQIDSKEEIAAILNVPRPSLSRELILLKQEGVIDFGKHYITIK